MTGVAPRSAGAVCLEFACATYCWVLQFPPRDPRISSLIGYCKQPRAHVNYTIWDVLRAIWREWIGYRMNIDGLNGQILLLWPTKCDWSRMSANGCWWLVLIQWAEGPALVLDDSMTLRNKREMLHSQTTHPRRFYPIPLSMNHLQGVIPTSCQMNNSPLWRNLQSCLRLGANYFISVIFELTY